MYYVNNIPCIFRMKKINASIYLFIIIPNNQSFLYKYNGERFFFNIYVYLK